MDEGAPAVIVVAPPWLRTGTGRVIEAQTAYYRQRGFRVAFIAIPTHASHTAENPIWQQHAAAIEDLRVDWTSTAPLERRENPRALHRRIGQAMRGSTILDWLAQGAASGKLQADILPFATDHPPVLIHANHVFSMKFVEGLRRRLARPRPLPVVVDTHDIQSWIMQDNAQSNPWTLQPDGLDQLLRSELALLRPANAIVHVSVDDFAFFAPRLPHHPHVLALPSIDPSFVDRAARNTGPPAGRPFDLLFVGANQIANAKALDWFLNQVWPLLADRGLVLKIVGGIIDMVRWQMPDLYARFEAAFVGPVADLVPFYRAAGCVIAPMVSGRGISIKTIEALALGIPFVGTSKAFRGMPMDIVREAGQRPHDRPEEFAGAILAARADPRPDPSGPALYRRLFSQEAYFSSLDVAFARAVGARPSRSPDNVTPRGTSPEDA